MSYCWTGNNTQVRPKHFSSAVPLLENLLSGSLANQWSSASNLIVWANHGRILSSTYIYLHTIIALFYDLLIVTYTRHTVATTSSAEWKLVVIQYPLQASMSIGGLTFNHKLLLLRLWEFNQTYADAMKKWLCFGRAIFPRLVCRSLL